MKDRKGPFFIIGVHRSGTTLLRYMLSSHSRLYVPEESDFIPAFFLGKAHNRLTRNQVGAMLEEIFNNYRFVREWQGTQPDVDDFWEEMPAPTPAAFLDTLYTRYARQKGAVRWGDKTPIYASYVGLLHKIFPDARFIHIVRDGRDAVLSLLDKYEADEFHVDVFFAARNWVRRIRAIDRARSKLPANHYYEVSYEQLVQNPEEELQKICAFLGERYESQMTAHHRMARRQIPVDSHFFDNVRNPVSDERAGRWEREMTPADLRLTQLVAGSLLVEKGYLLKEVGPMPVREQARLFLLAVKYVTLQSGRRVLQALGIFPPI